MRRFVYQLVDRLADPDSGISRNRHFALLSSPAGARARKLFRHLESIERDLERWGDEAQVTASRDGAETVLRVEIPPLRLVRTARLTDDDLAVVRRHPGPLADRLAAALPTP